MYSLKVADGPCKKTAKGISSFVTANILRHEDYIDCLFNGRSMVNEVRRIGHSDHQLKVLRLTNPAYQHLMTNFG